MPMVAWRLKTLWAGCGFGGFDESVESSRAGRFSRVLYINWRWRDFFAFLLQLLEDGGNLEYYIFIC